MVFLAMTIISFTLYLLLKNKYDVQNNPLVHTLRAAAGSALTVNPLPGKTHVCYPNIIIRAVA